MNPYLAGCRAKLRRAKDHFNDFDKIQKAWIETNPNEIVHKNNPDAREYLVLCEKAAIPPLELSILIGEIIHGLRACLDNLIYALAIAETQSDPPPYECSLAFPVVTDEKDFSKKWTKRLSILSIEAQARIESLQPFREPPSLQLHQMRLWVLDKLNNIDKHRRLNVVATATHEMRLSANRPVELQALNPGPYKDNTTILRYATDGSQDVQVEANLSFHIAFNEPDVLPHYPDVVPILLDLGEVVEWTVDTFENDFF